MLGLYIKGLPAHLYIPSHSDFRFPVSSVLNVDSMEKGQAKRSGELFSLLQVLFNFNESVYVVGWCKVSKYLKGLWCN